jgi:uncharacterized membrane protein YeaQ/YmgE (transglycosylase-associated protein family)
MLIALLRMMLVGLVAGWLAGMFMKGRYSALTDIFLGIVGGVIGGFVFGLFGLTAWNLIGSIVTSFVGAVILILLVRQIKKA